MEINWGYYQAKVDRALRRDNKQNWLIAWTSSIISDIIADIERKAFQSEAHGFISQELKIYLRSFIGMNPLIIDNLTMNVHSQKALDNYLSAIENGGTLVFSFFGESTLNELKKILSAVEINLTGRFAQRFMQFIDPTKLGNYIISKGFRNTVMLKESLRINSTILEVTNALRDVAQTSLVKIPLSRNVLIEASEKLQSVTFEMIFMSVVHNPQCYFSTGTKNNS